MRRCLVVRHSTTSSSPPRRRSCWGISPKLFLFNLIFKCRLILYILHSSSLLLVSPNTNIHKLRCVPVSWFFTPSSVGQQFPLFGAAQRWSQHTKKTTVMKRKRPRLSDRQDGRIYLGIRKPLRASGRCWPPEPAKQRKWGTLGTGIVEMRFTKKWNMFHSSGNSNRFYADETTNGLGECERVLSQGLVSMWVESGTRSRWRISKGMLKLTWNLVFGYSSIKYVIKIKFSVELK